MKLVMLYTVGDGYTYSCDIVKPLEYESKEKAEYDLLELCESQMKNNPNESCINFAGHQLDYLDFYYEGTCESRKNPEIKVQSKYVYSPPSILTIDEWFKDEGQTAD